MFIATGTGGIDSMDPFRPDVEAHSRTYKGYEFDHHCLWDADARTNMF